MAHLKTADHSAVVLSAAIKELQELRPVHGAWEALVASSARQLEELQAEAAKLRQEVAEVDSAGAQGREPGCWLAVALCRAQGNCRWLRLRLRVEGFLLLRLTSMRRTAKTTEREPG